MNFLVVKGNGEQGTGNRKEVQGFSDLPVYGEMGN
jgi:hypothetical protein